MLANLILTLSFGLLAQASILEIPMEAWKQAGLTGGAV